MFSSQDWDELIADHAPPRALIVAVDATERVVGFAATKSEACKLFLLFVDPAWAGRGVGRMLLAAAHDALRAAGCDEAFLYTEERNARARAVYAAAGYRADGTVRESDFHGLSMREVRVVKAFWQRPPRAH